MIPKTCLLNDQLIQYFGDLKNVPEEFGCFLTAVNKVYIQSNNEKKLLEQTIAKQSKELSRATLELNNLGRMLPDIVMRLNRAGKILEIKTRKMHCYYSTSSPFLGQNILELPVGRLNKNFQQALKNLNKSSPVIILDIVMDLERRDLCQACLLLTPSNQIIVFIRSRQALTEKKDWIGAIFNTSENSPESAYIREEAKGSIDTMKSGPVRSNLWDTGIADDPRRSISYLWDMDFFFPYFSGSIFSRNNLFLNGHGLILNKMVRSGAEKVFRAGKSQINFPGHLSGSKETSQSQALKKNTAARAEKIKRLFLANVSHEIRTPLNAILGFSQLIEMRIGPLMGKEEIDFMKIIRNSGKRLLRTIHEILDMAELEAGAYIKKSEYMDLSNLVNALISEFKPKADEKDLRMIFNKGIKSARIYADKYGISLALENIIDNAVKYTNRGSVTINLGLDSGQYLLSINDTGMGISNLYMEKIFGIFSQESEGFTRKFQGLGLGLSLARAHLELNDVGLKVESKKGTGTKFLLSFVQSK